tara:strand:- start:58 stop:828 length:771 start_codon:yes stop_codon:yes gene_type:complete
MRKKQKSKVLNKKENLNSTNNKTIRLNKFLSNAGICSRREADKFITAGAVSVNGVGITKMGYKISPADIIKFDGQKVTSDTPRYVLLNKPKNYSGRVNNETRTPSVMSLIGSACKEKIYPIDKLNKTETGLLIFTNDTDLAKKLNNKNQIIKSIYQITLDKNLTQMDLERIKKGFFFNGGKASFKSISYIQNKDKNELGIEHNRGGTKYIKEVFKQLNYNVIKLDRVFFGGLTKKQLPRKHYRHLSKDEIAILKRL